MQLKLPLFPIGTVLVSNCLGVYEQTITMQICEQQTVIGDVSFREIRRLTDSGHQTAIITTNKVISSHAIAGKMFGRWSQENFFRYMIIDYDFDKMIEFGTETIDENKEVVNPQYRQLTNKLKKELVRNGPYTRHFFTLPLLLTKNQ